MKPYFQSETVTLYNAPCEDVLPIIGKVDLVLTDPPYGIARVWKGGSGHGWGKAKADTAERNSWDAAAPAIETIDALIANAKYSVIWGGNYFPLPPSRGWFIWTKPERNFTLSEAELAWTNKDTVMRVFDGKRSDQGREHPTQKPVGLMTWCLNHFKNCATVFDPYTGSGTTGVACVRLGRKFIGVEIEEKYCEISAKRIERELAQGKLFEPQTIAPPKQMSLCE